MVDGMDMLGDMKRNIAGNDMKVDMLKHKINVHKKMDAKKKINHLAGGGRFI